MFENLKRTYRAFLPAFNKRFTKINLSVDAAFGLEYLVILSVKLEKNPNNEKILLNYRNTWNNLLKELGSELFCEICDSLEYQKMVKINTEFYDLVDLCKTDEIKASDFMKANLERYKVKNELQKKFFGDELSEVKV